MTKPPTPRRASAAKNLIFASGSSGSTKPVGWTCAQCQRWAASAVVWDGMGPNAKQKSLCRFGRFRGLEVERCARLLSIYIYMDRYEWINIQLSGVQNCVFFSCREIKPYSGPYAKLTCFYALLTVTHVCMAILTFLLTANICKSTMVTYEMLLQNKKGNRIKINKCIQVSLPVAFRHRSSLHILTANLTDTSQTSAKITMFTYFSPVPD